MTSYDDPLKMLDEKDGSRHLADRTEFHTPKPAGSSAMVETTHDVRILSARAQAAATALSPASLLAP